MSGDTPAAPGTRLADGRWAPGTLVRTPDGVRARVLRCFSEGSTQYGDAVFVETLQRPGEPERPWQLWSSTRLTPLDVQDHAGQPDGQPAVRARSGRR